MNIGIIIFIISVIITGVSALRDKSHEDRQNQRPNQKPSNEQPQEGGFFEKLEKTFKEISDELNDEPEKKQSKPYETAPRSWPKSSDSRRDPGMAAQFTATKGASGLGPA